MSVITGPTITQNAVSAMYSENYLSVHDVIDKPQVIQEIYNKYGAGWTLVQTFRNMKGSTGTYAGETLKAYEKAKPVRTITTNGASTGGETAGSLAYIVLSEDDVDSNSNIYPRTYDKILYKHTDNKVYELLITDIASTSASGAVGSYDTFQLTLKPLDNTLTVTVGGISDGTELSVVGNSYAHGTGQPDGTVRGYYEKTFKTGISKETKQFDGAELASEKWVPSENGVYSLAYADLEFMLDMREDMNYVVGQENDNNITQSSPIDSANRTVRSTKGLWQHLEEDAGKLNYGTGDWDIYLFDEVDTYLRTMYVTNDTLGFYMGAGLMKKLERAGLEWIKEYSGGTDLTRIASAAYGGDEDMALSNCFKAFKKAGRTFVCHVIDTFSAPDYLGNSTYDFDNSGFIASYGAQVKDPKTGLSLPNIGVWYRSMGDTNRKRVIKPVNGMTGWNGAQTVNANDVLSVYALSEGMLVAMETEKMLQVNPR